MEKLIDFVMIQQIKPQTQSFLEGFFSIFPKSELDVIDWMELGSKISGAQEIDSTLQKRIFLAILMVFCFLVSIANSERVTIEHRVHWRILGAVIMCAVVLGDDDGTR